MLNFLNSRDRTILTPEFGPGYFCFHCEIRILELLSRGCRKFDSDLQSFDFSENIFSKRTDGGTNGRRRVKVGCQGTATWLEDQGLKTLPKVVGKMAWEDVYRGH